MDRITPFQQGDPHSFEALFAQLYHRLFAYGYQLLREQHAAEDVVQEAFVALWHQREQFQHELAIRSFLYTTVRHKCLNLLRHEQVKQQNEPHVVAEYAQATDPQVIEEEYFGLLHEAINKLPAASQRIMLLVLQGHKNREIADALGISENTVKTQKKIAYAKLRETLGPKIHSWLLTLSL